MKQFWKYFMALTAVALLGSTGVAQADTMSVSQTIVVTAVVAPARSIVVNQAGQMIRIYSNTSENVAPKVYVDNVPGPSSPLTPALLRQYNQVIEGQKKLNGVAISVQSPTSKTVDPAAILMKTISSFMRPLYL